ncbi:MAG: hypothetical protein COT73_03390 [Bdellovibrio sp. CG10_big_fil_rev_8_21_14_0_10_47_8]|nr:MAG: hypothetical protein COT73_03390 [Bdellovibrio sp. CG10_big_fil_rev_8_21_14_0_10_47_8]
MADIDKEILEDFLSESKDLMGKMVSTLEACEGDFSQVKGLEDYGLNVDRIMGAAKSIAMMVPEDPNHLIHKVGDYAAVCKAVGYKASQIRDNVQFYDICVALLLDGTEVLEAMVDGLSNGRNEIKGLFSQTFLERLRWVSSQFGEEYRASVDIHKGQKTKMNQDDIDDLLKKLGLD